MPSRWAAFNHRADLYARRVLGDLSAGTQIVAGPYVRAACRRHLGDRTTPRNGMRFVEAAADNAIAFFETVLRLPDTQDDEGNPQPFLLQPWQAFIIGSLFGWRRADG